MSEKSNIWQQRLEKAFQSREPFLGHVMKPLPLRDNPARSEKVSTYMELELLEFLEEYAIRMGSRSTSEALRRLAIIGALAEGYCVDVEPRDLNETQASAV